MHDMGLLNMTTDARGLDITGKTASARAFDGALADYWGLTGDPVGKLKSALAEDTEFPLGATAIAALYMIGGFRGDHPEVTGAIAKARAAETCASARERKHLAAVEAWAAGRAFAAAALWEDILADEPRDALALRLVQDAHFFLGQPLAIRDATARVKPFWTRDDPLYGYFLGARAFGLEEAGELAAAEVAGREAIAINPGDAWAVHALAHVFETACRFDEGEMSLRAWRPHWRAAHFMAGHNGWHLALYLIERRAYAEVLADYDQFCLPRLADDATLDRVDAAALLWRLELQGVDVGDRWGPVSLSWMKHVDDHVLAFNDLHLALAAARSPDPDDARRLRASLETYLRTQSGDLRNATAEIGLPLIDGVLKFGAGDYRGALDAMLPVARRAIRIGGSHAQRDIVPLTLIAAAERAGEKHLTRALLAERLAVRPTDRVKSEFARALVS
jgi:tetratricopeptide (TPR) repeat protein